MQVTQDIFRTPHSVPLYLTTLSPSSVHLVPLTFLNEEQERGGLSCKVPLELCLDISDKYNYFITHKSCPSRTHSNRVWISSLPLYNKDCFSSRSKHRVPHFIGSLPLIVFDVPIPSSSSYIQLQSHFHNFKYLLQKYPVSLYQNLVLLRCITKYYGHGGNKQNKINFSLFRR